MKRMMALSLMELDVLMVVPELSTSVHLCRPDWHLPFPLATLFFFPFWNEMGQHAFVGTEWS